MSSNPKSLVWLVSGNTYALDNSGMLKPLGHSGKWIAEEINAMRKENINVEVVPVKGFRSYCGLLLLDLSSTKVRIQGVEFIFSFLAYVLLKNRAMEIEFDLQGFPQDISKNYFRGGWMKLSSFYGFPAQVLKELAKWGQYYVRGLLAEYLLKQDVSFRGRTNYDRSKIQNSVPYIRKERSVRKIDSVGHVLFDEYIILIPQVHYPTKGLHLIIQDLAKFARLVNLRIYLGGTKPKGYYGIHLKNVFLSLKDDLKIEYIVDTIYSYDNILNSCDLVLLPSIVENSSNSIKEARNVEKICLVQRSGGNLEMIKNYSNGYSYCHRNNGQLLHMLNEILRENS